MPKQARKVDVARRLLRWTAADASAMIALGGVGPADIERALVIENARSRPRKKMRRVLAKYLPAQ